MAKLGHEVVGIDVDPGKVGLLTAGEPSFFEPELSDLLVAVLQTGRLRFTTDIAEARGAAVHFLTVGTPQLVGGHAADLGFVDAAITNLLPHLRAGDLVVGKSTVPVGTAARLADVVRNTAPDAVLAWNPEFLREGFAIGDTLAPDRLVYGVPAGDAGEMATATLDRVYATALARGTPRLVMDYATAELVKVAANAFLATKVSFINAMAEITEATGADVTVLADAIGYDPRIGRRFLNSGLGFGGGCLPKDIRAFQARAEELGLAQSVAFLGEVDAINLRRRDRMVELTREVLGGELTGKRVAVLGLAFKPNSDDVRDSPALDVASRLAAEGAFVVATDPAAVHSSRALHPELRYVDSAARAVEHADVVLVLTEWAEYCELVPAELDSVSSTVILDGRNCLSRSVWENAGWVYRALGRP
jgi:UDPglucose 6-dehydrogenase